MRPRLSIQLFIGVFCTTVSLLAQENNEILNEDLGEVSDAFQEYFFEGLKQKGIENYELALEALQKAQRATNSNEAQQAVVYFEMGKNLTKLKRYDEAEESFKKVMQTMGERMDVMEALYNVYYEKRDYESAIPWVQKLIKNNEDYKEDLVGLYHKTRQYDKVLKLLDELDESWGESVYRDSLRKQIYRVTGNSEGAIKNLESKIDKNPKNEQDYINLIYLYSEEGNTQKAFEIAQQLLKQHPNSKKAHLALYKSYLEADEINQALHSITILFGASDIDREIKEKVLGDFLSYISQNPQHEAILEQMLPSLSNMGNGDFYEALGDFYVGRKNKEQALQYYKKGLALDVDNFSLIKNTILLQIDTQKFKEAITVSEDALAIFPAQALLYLLNGVAHNELNEPNSAIESLEMGLDFLLDDPNMEKDFYLQLSKAYSLKNDTKKAEEYQNKATKIQLSN